MILTPKNWSDFQHYKDRAPSWIKLHRGLLDNYDYWCLPIASRALAPCLWLLASEYYDGKIDASLDSLAFRLRMTRGELADALNPLIDAGFFDASEPLAQCKQNASPEKRREREETERETEKRQTRAREDDWPSDYREQFWNLYPNRVGKGAALQKLDAVRKRGILWQVLLGGLQNYIATKPLDRQWCNPATWLNQERWSDEPAEIKSIAKPTTVAQQRQQESRDVLNAMREFNASTGGGTDLGVLRHDTGNGPPSLRGGTGGNLIDISPGRDRSSG